LLQQPATKCKTKFNHSRNLFPGSRPTKKIYMKKKKEIDLERERYKTERKREPERMNE
jgi:hypothetical protein